METLRLQDIPRVKPGQSAKARLRSLDEVDQERLYLATRAKDLLGYSGLVADVTGEISTGIKLGPLAEALNGLEIQTLDLGGVIEYQMQEMIRATKEKIFSSLRDWATRYFSEAGWSKTGLESYEHPIPEFVLQTAIRLKEKLPEVTFHIQHMRDPKADPFLIASMGREIYYLEAWDEPRFEGRTSR